MSYEIAVVAAILGIIALFAYLSVKLEDNHFAIKTFFMLLSLLFVVVGLVILKGIADVNYSTGIASLLNTVYIVYLSIFIFLAMFFIINTLLHVLSIGFEKKRENEQ